MVWVLVNLDRHAEIVFGVYNRKIDAVNDWWNRYYGGKELSEEDYDEYIRFRDIIIECGYDETTQLALYDMAVEQDISLKCTFPRANDKSEDVSGSLRDKYGRDKYGLIFPSERFKHKLKQLVTRDINIGEEGVVYLTAVIEYLVCEVLELSGNAAKKNKSKRINPKHIQMAIKGDEELTELTRNWALTPEQVAEIPIKKIQLIFPDQYGREVVEDMEPLELPPL